MEVYCRRFTKSNKIKSHFYQDHVLPFSGLSDLMYKKESIQELDESADV